MNEETLTQEASAVYEKVTAGLTRPLRVAEMLYEVADHFPGLLPTRDDILEERTRPQKDKAGLEVAQGLFTAAVLADPELGLHLLHSMTLPTPTALNLLPTLQEKDAVDLGPVRVERQGRVGAVILQNHAALNAEDDDTTAALETAVDLVLLDDAVDVGLLRGAVSEHPKYAGRRVFGAGVNLTRLYRGQISLIHYMLEKEMGVIAKMYRGHGLGGWRGQQTAEDRREKGWVAAVEQFAIGGACQWLLVMDAVVADEGAFFSLPARKEGIIPGLANLRLPRFVGERLSREAILHDRHIQAASPEGRLLADVVVPEAGMDMALDQLLGDLTSSGTVSLVANRRATRAGCEPLAVFRHYMATYAREQTRCMYSQAMVDNLERYWLSRSS